MKRSRSGDDDGSGRASGEELRTLRAELEASRAKNATNAWTLRTLQAELEAARAENAANEGTHAMIAGLDFSLLQADAANAEQVVTIADLKAARKAQRSANRKLKAKVAGFEVAEKRRTEMSVEETARMPAPMTKFEMVERYSKTLCIAPQHAKVLKQTWARALGILSVKASIDGIGCLPDVMAEKGVKLAIWDYLEVDHEVELDVRVLKAPVSECIIPRARHYRGSNCTLANMLISRTFAWRTVDGVLEDSFSVAVPDRSRVTAFVLATYGAPCDESLADGYGPSTFMRIDQLDGYALDSLEVVPWGHKGKTWYSDLHEDSKRLDMYTSERVAVQTGSATTFKVSVKQFTHETHHPDPHVGVAVFRVLGVAPRK